MGKGQQQHNSLGCRGGGRGSKGTQQILRNRSLKCMEWQAEVQHEQQQVQWMTANQQGRKQHGTANAGATADARLQHESEGQLQMENASAQSVTVPIAFATFATKSQQLTRIPL